MYGWLPMQACRLQPIMPIYKAHTIDSYGRFRNSIDLDLADEASAIEFAKRLVMRGYDVELWDGKRKIATFKSGE